MYLELSEKPKIIPCKEFLVVNSFEGNKAFAFDWNRNRDQPDIDYLDNFQFDDEVEIIRTCAASFQGKIYILNDFRPGFMIFIR